jgi:hypothetical protein
MPEKEAIEINFQLHDGSSSGARGAQSPPTAAKSMELMVSYAPASAALVVVELLQELAAGRKDTAYPKLQPRPSHTSST